MEEKEYKCICGKIFNNSQSFNAHKSNCKIHYINKYENLDKYIEFHNNNKNKKSGETLHKNAVIKKEEKLKQWISEQHKCEHCSKIMTEYYGSGRFCSKSCANSRKQSQETKEKISRSCIKIYNKNISNQDIENIRIKNKENKLNRKHKIKYNGPKLPNIKKDNIKSGYQNRNRIPYSERFWKLVLDNNSIKYKQNVNVWKPGLNNYFLDFLIDENIDLEIDGSFHELNDIKEKDIKRDKYLKSIGFIVYRIKWINPNTDKNKQLVNEQIENLFKFLNKLRIK